MSKNGSTPRRGANPPTDEELAYAIPRGRVGREFQVGIFVILGVASLLTAMFLLTDPSTFRGRYKITTSVADAGGLRRGDPVQMKGVNIGQVDRFTLAPDGVVITLELDGAWRVPSDSRTRLVSSGILGGKTVEVLPGSSPEPLPSGGSLPGENVEGLMDFPPELGQSAQDVLVRIRELLDTSTVEAVQSSASELQELLSQLSDLTEAQGAEVARLTGTLNRAALGLETAAGSGEDWARAVARADSALAGAMETGRTLERASASLAVILQRMEEGEGTLGRLSTDASLYENLSQAAESILLLAQDVRENPGRYVKVEIF